MTMLEIARAPQREVQNMVPEASLQDLEEERRGGSGSGDS